MKGGVGAASTHKLLVFMTSIISSGECLLHVCVMKNIKMPLTQLTNVMVAQMKIITMPMTLLTDVMVSVAVASRHRRRGRCKLSRRSW